MSIENISKNQICDDQLEKVSGGDVGDVKSERSKTPGGVKPRYSVGDYVEVYSTSAHIRTKRSRIESIRIVYGDIGTPRYVTNFSNYYWPLYKVFVIEDNEYREVSSDDIES